MCVTRKEKNIYVIIVFNLWQGCLVFFVFFVSFRDFVQVRAFFACLFSVFSGSVAAFEPLRFDSVDLGHRPFYEYVKGLYAKKSGLPRHVTRLHCRCSAATVAAGRYDRE